VWDDVLIGAQTLRMVVDRKDDKFALFFYRLFAEMFKGRSMLVVWAELAPQIPGRTHSDAPEFNNGCRGRSRHISAEC